ncbi:potassium channel family protein [Roseivirga sp. E12]|uniref:potassium channel family protein n=1 Tax=Roseivirga sp. E12 TaxID=2819237 RepID=UPI001ABD2ABB|nr:potassium channel family protein [Roseivirga sp. E12]MBO3699250.1 two pore domain potassium channel family protein [Roseivirga sp. E12]
MIFFRTLISFLKDPEYRSLLLASVGILVIGTVAYHYIEGWGWLDSLYFSTITLTTIGYGDFSPQTDLGKIFTVVYIAIGVGMVLTFLNTLYKHFRDFPNKDVKK